MHRPEERMIPLVTGDPSLEAPASFTRFALPFVWKLKRAGDDSQPERFYRRTSPPRIVERCRYFTLETAGALFRRACWFELKEPEGGLAASFPALKVNIAGTEIDVAIAPPRLVLFEAAGLFEQNSDRVDVVATGFLLVDLYFPKEGATLEDLLLINEMFRYWRKPFVRHATKKCETSRGVAQYREVMAALDGVLRTASRGSRRGEATDRYFDRWDSLLSFPIEIEGKLHKWTLDGRNEARTWTESVSARGEQGSGTNLNTVLDETGWIAYTDERAFVWTCALTEHGTAQLWPAGASSDPSESGDWVRLLNVDRPSGSPATAFEKQWVKERTYERWKHFDTLYGFNTHSGAMLASPCCEPPTWRHFSELYFDQVLLLLYLRVSTFRFSAALAKISALPGDRKGALKEFRDIRRDFAFLTNLYRFPLLSSQQQGIEMYAYARKGLDVNELFEEVQSEIETTHEMFELATASQMSATAAVLACGALVVGVLAVVMGLLSAGDLAKQSPRAPLLRLLSGLPWFMPSWWLIIFASVLSLFGSLVIWRRLRL